MTTNDGKVSSTTLIGIGLATLVFAGMVLYAGYRFAILDVCAQVDRFSVAVLATTIASVISMIFLIWGAVRGHTWRTILVGVASSLASLVLIAFAALLFLGLGMSEPGAEVSVSEDNGLHISVEEGFRIRSLRVEGTGVGKGGRWSITAIDEIRPPLSQNVRRYTLGQTPAGYEEQESTIKLDGALPDGDYRVEAIMTCPYGPARTSFTIKQGRLQSTGH